MSFRLHGPLRYRALSVWDLLGASGTAALRAITGRRRVANWPWDLDAANEFSRRRLRRAMRQRTMHGARAPLDSLVFNSPPAQPVRTIPSRHPALRGDWLLPANAATNRTLLYFHGGGYAFYASAHQSMMQHIAIAARARTFALDYRLAPEHPYPAQLDDAFAAYRALIDSDTPASRVVVAGDSAGGHLVISLLRRLRDSNLPMPALGIALCPWTAVGDRSRSVFRNDRYDWITGARTLQFSRWAFGARAIVDAENVSPMQYDVRGFPPLYLQAGGREALADQIHRFAKKVGAAAGIVTLDVWPDMTHDFQAFGALLCDSAEALDRIGVVVDHYLGFERRTPLTPCARTIW